MVDIPKKIKIKDEDIEVSNDAYALWSVLKDILWESQRLS